LVESVEDADPMPHGGDSIVSLISNICVECPLRGRERGARTNSVTQRGSTVALRLRPPNDCVVWWRDDRRVQSMQSRRGTDPTV